MRQRGTQLVKVLAGGVWGVLATPFRRASLDICEASLARSASHYESIGAAGLTVLGVFGEASKLSSREQSRVLEVVAGATEGLPIVAGLPGQATEVVIEQGPAAVNATGDRLAGLMVMINTPDPVELSRHFRAVHHATGQGIVAQDYPVASGVRIATRDLAQVVNDNADILVAVKSEAPPTGPAIAALSGISSVPVFGGLGGVGLIDELTCGAAGAMTGFSFPEALIATVTAFERGGFDDAREVFAPWLPLVNFEAQQVISLAVRKECLRLRGLVDEAAVRPPAAKLPAVLGDIARRHVEAGQALLGAA